MEKIIVEQSPPLSGVVRVSGAKNSVLPILAASLLSTEKCILEDVPSLKDVEVLCELLTSLGADVLRKKANIIEVNSKNLDNDEAPYDLIRRMRASFLVMGPLLARMGKTRISLPGGCAIGSRPIDLHLKGFKALGAEITMGNGFIEATAEKLIGTTIYLDFPSVGATENIMMAATLAEGQTLIENAAEEPEIIDLANFLNKMGANIKGAGTDTIRIQGVKKLTGTQHTVIPDRIEAGTYIIGAAMTGGDVIVENVVSFHIHPLIAKLREAGVYIEELDNERIHVKSNGNMKTIDIKTLPYPGFPTDLQAQMMAMLSRIEGASMITETVFENRFMHVDELKRMGANIRIDNRTAILEGVSALTGAEVSATDLRAGAALVLAGLVAQGKTIINNIYHIDRGYDGIEEKLRGLGAIIYRQEM
ncbi:UDP-N-acetylglucosamine 1-carboxyvinyltransferase [Irregularibacter muris]|uniref:UDP-N-acetylglucosamine 1-carboxyvinyltransferase n=1 Tax=Irregularibacter muris TaxID=1796619 RepID=A0AAE3L042_9FIRM|nr:UDP-N-acetylglucosamine 1-carboxyvinyltransferase [Irregularibacter muris]MCR1900195.1 UDP-N-acetylglucosamine 1-carboxyvinyltransferase [Irregularibacter muris]